MPSVTDAAGPPPLSSLIPPSIPPSIPSSAIPPSIPSTLPAGGFGYWTSVLDLGPPAGYESTGAGPGGNPAGNPYQAPPAGTGTGTTGTTEPAVPDWEQALIAMGMPPELVSQIRDYYAAHADDPDVGVKALALVRGSDWWKSTFAGFWQGYALGMFTDETGYRAWQKAANDAFTRFYGRAMTSDETISFLTQGFSPTTIEQIGSGHAIAETNRPDLQWATGAFDATGALTDAEREAYGQELAGRDTALGQQIKARVDKALAVASRVFQGDLAQPNMQIGGAGLAAPSLNPQPKPDIGA